MRNLFQTLLGFIMVIGTSSNGAARDWSIKEMILDPSLKLTYPDQIKICPDGTVTYLKPESPESKQNSLWLHPGLLENGSARNEKILISSRKFDGALASQSELDKQERLRKEAGGILSYSRSCQSGGIAFVTPKGLYYQNRDEKGVHLSPEGSELFLSPDGDYVSYARNSNLFLRELKAKAEVPLTSDGSATLSYGTAEFIAQEEMRRMIAQWWSADSQWLAFTQVDESPVDLLKRPHLRPQGLEVQESRYPRAGTNNAKVRLALVHRMHPEKLYWLPENLISDGYLVWAGWHPSRALFAFQVQSRDQKTLTLYFVHPENTHFEIEKIKKETRLDWISTQSAPILFLKDRMIYISEQKNYPELVLSDLQGRNLRSLTHGDWSVHRPLFTDPKEEFLYFSGSKDSPLERHLYRLSLDQPSLPIEKLSETGSTTAIGSAQAPFYLQIHSQETQPFHWSLHSFQGHSQILYAPQLPPSVHFQTRERGSFISSGETLYYSLLKPKTFKEGIRYPVVVDVYGGPESQSILDEYQGSFRLIWREILANKGYLVLSLDNRGTGNRGKRFSRYLHGKLGQIEASDQAKGVEHLVKLGLADPNQVALMGWSYGGYVALMGLLQKTETFKAAIAIAPVTDWALYDTHYTERYLGLPKDNPKGYKSSNVMEYAKNLKGALLLVHGLEDDNVFFSHTALIAQAFQNLGLGFEMMIYPDSKHGITGDQKRIHLFETILRFLEQHLKLDVAKVSPS